MAPSNCSTIISKVAPDPMLIPRSDSSSTWLKMVVPRPSVMITWTAGGSWQGSRRRSTRNTGNGGGRLLLQLIMLHVSVRLHDKRFAFAIKLSTATQVGLSCVVAKSVDGWKMKVNKYCSKLYDCKLHAFSYLPIFRNPIIKTKGTTKAAMFTRCALIDFKKFLIKQCSQQSVEWLLY